MKRKYFSLILGASFALFSLTLMSASTEDQVITKEDGVTIPKFFARLKDLLTSWDGKTVSKASKTEPDAVSGATYSSNAVIKNVQTGLKYYQDNK